MLKLEKNRKQEINIQFRVRQPFFNRTFLYAFAIAFALHLFPILIFQIRSLFIVDKGILAPTMVEVGHIPLELDEGTSVALANKEKKQNLLALHPSDPTLPSLPPAKTNHNTAFEEKIPTYNPFIKVEENLFSTDLPKKNSASVDFHISGPLAQVPLLNEKNIKEKSLHLTLEKPIKYEVRMDHHSGQIFWYLQKELANSALTNKLSEILREMHFENSSKNFVTMGEIEFFPEFNND